MSSTLVRANEKHYRPNEIAKLWGCSPKTIRAIFEKEEGVLDLGEGKHRMLSVPESVMNRVHARRSQRGKRR